MSDAMDRLARPTIEQKIRVLDWHRQHGTKSQQFTVDHFNKLQEFSISKSSFNRWLKDEQKLRKTYGGLDFNNKSNYKKAPVFKNDGIDRCLIKFYQQSLFENLATSESLLLAKWKFFAQYFRETAEDSDARGDGDKEKSNGWIYHFKQRNRLKKDLILNWLNLQSKLNMLSIEDDLKRIQQEISQYEAKDVYHFDELVVTSRMVPNAPMNKESKFIVGLCCNSDLSEIRNPLVINSRLPRFSNRSDFFFCQSNTSLITDEIFYKYMSSWNEEIAENQPNRKVLLLIDCLYQHVIPFDQLEHIDVVWFNPNFETFYSRLMSNRQNMFYYRDLELEIQPLNLGVIKAFKTLFKISLGKHYLFESLKSVNEIRIDHEEILEIIIGCIRRLKDLSNMLLPCFHHFNSISNQQVTIKPLEAELFKILNLLNNEKIILNSQNFTIDQIIFPNDEFILNLHYSDEDIVRLAKIEMAEVQSLAKIPVSSSQATQSLATIQQMMNEFEQYIQSNPTQFHETIRQFQTLRTQFIEDCMKTYTQAETAPAVPEEHHGNILPELLNR